MSNGKRGGQPGNTNPARGKIFRDGIRWALEHYKDEGNPLDKVVSTSWALYKMCLEQVKKAADAGDLSSFRELADRMDGKPVQVTEIGGIDGEPIPTTVTIGFGSIAPDSEDDST